MKLEYIWILVTLFTGCKYHTESDSAIKSLSPEYTKINRSTYNLPYYDLNNPFRNRNFIGTAAFGVQTPVGPISTTVNYIPTRSQSFSFMLNFGYLLFNERLSK